MFGELEGQASRLSPDMHMDSTVGQLVASGLATAGTLLCASLLRNAQRSARRSLHDGCKIIKNEEISLIVLSLLLFLIVVLSLFAGFYPASRP